MNSNNSDDHDFKLSGSDWLHALEELEGSASATSLRPRKKVKSLTPLPIAAPPKTQSPVPQIVEELQGAIQEELDRIKAFVGTHPYLIAPQRPPHVGRQLPRNKRHARPPLRTLAATPRRIAGLRTLTDNTPEKNTPNDTPSLEDEQREATPTSPSRYQEAINHRSFSMEKADIGIISEFSKIIAQNNKIGRLIEKLRLADPTLAPERVFDGWEDGAKECNTVMLHEFYAMRNGRQAKKYDARHVCKECNSVFMVPLPADGICDACRAAKAPRSSPY
jgi:hypothetical protein